MLKCVAAKQLGVTPSRVSQLIKDGHLRVEPDGSVTPEAVEDCRRSGAVAWQHPGMKSGRRSAATRQRERVQHLWTVVGAKMRGKGYSGDWNGRTCEQAYSDLRECINSVAPELLS